jgi:hypothetical protein
MASRFEVLLGCTKRVGVDRVGDRESRWGFLYDEHDGTGLDMRPALVLHTGRGDARWDVLQLSTKRRCLSVAADPNGAGEDARPTSRAGAKAKHRQLLRTLHRLEKLEDRVETRTERFDEWESCLAWLPLTEAGDLDQDFGFLTDQGLPPYERVHYPAIDIDHSEWDDPGYQVLAFRGSDRPFAQEECGTDPGEAPDRPVLTRGGGDESVLAEVRQGIRALREGVEDLAEPVDEISRFDQCLYTVGVATNPGYLFRDRAGTDTRRPALSFDMRGARLPQMSVMAFPGEEPPQIECNEDAGGVQTDE